MKPRRPGIRVSALTGAALALALGAQVGTAGAAGTPPPATAAPTEPVPTGPTTTPAPAVPTGPTGPTGAAGPVQPAPPTAPPPTGGGNKPRPAPEKPGKTPGGPPRQRPRVTLRVAEHLAVRGRPIAVSGTVRPFVRGQHVRVHFILDGHRRGARTIAIRPAHRHAGRFELRYTPARAGHLRIRAAHAPSARQRGFADRTPPLRVYSPVLTPGEGGPLVRLLQRDLARLHFAVPQSGRFEDLTEQAVVAYRKANRLPRDYATDDRIFKLLERRVGGFPVRYPHDGRHFEADLATQLLAEIEPGGRVREIYTISSGKPSTPTVLGRYHVYLKTPGVNSEGMVDSNYFIRGYAIHGYAEVPTYAASHGCLRVPIPDAPAIYTWALTGTPVDVYY